MYQAGGGEDRNGRGINALGRGRRTSVETAKIRRNVPPELAVAISQERLSWTLNLKGLSPEAMKVEPARPRLRVRLAGEAQDGPTLTLRAALQRIEALRPEPALENFTPGQRKQAADLERWFMGEVADQILWCLLRPPVPKGPGGYADQFMTAVIYRAMEEAARIRGSSPYLFGSRLSSADIAVAAVLAPAVCNEGWTWAARNWAPMSAVAGRSNMVRHPTGVWVRGLYERHAQSHRAAPNLSRAWVP